MKKIDAIKLFGTTQVDLSKAVKRSRSAICQWEDELDDDKKMLVLGAAVLKRLPIPEYLLDEKP
jgi:hypothetical protein